MKMKTKTPVMTPEELPLHYLQYVEGVIYRLDETQGSVRPWSFDEWYNRIYLPNKDKYTQDDLKTSPRIAVRRAKFLINWFVGVFEGRKPPYPEKAFRGLVSLMKEWLAWDVNKEAKPQDFDALLNNILDGVYDGDPLGFQTAVLGCYGGEHYDTFVSVFYRYLWVQNADLEGRQRMEEVLGEFVKEI
jgi:hypothetical protein